MYMYYVYMYSIYMYMYVLYVHMQYVCVCVCAYNVYTCAMGGVGWAVPACGHAPGPSGL